MHQFIGATGEEFTTKNRKATKTDEKLYEDFFVLFVVKLISGWGQEPRWFSIRGPAHR
jgi:hypothetical protein